MPAAGNLKRLYAYARMIEQQLKEEDASDLTYTEAAFHAEKLSVWLEELVWKAEEDQSETETEEVAL